ncbi:MAG: hypothetical protein R3F61_02485 [Myxococcota bacterium]
MLVLLGAALAFDPANTTVTSGPWTVKGQTDHAIHTHGGAPAKLDSAPFEVVLAGTTPATLEVKRVEYLRAHSCDADARFEVAEEPVASRLDVQPSEPAAQGADPAGPSWEIQPGTHLVRVAFSPVEAYYTHCDRFQLRVTFRSGEHTLTAISETLVSREEPYDPEQ